MSGHTEREEIVDKPAPGELVAVPLGSMTSSGEIANHNQSMRDIIDTDPYIAESRKLAVPGMFWPGREAVRVPASHTIAGIALPPCRVVLGSSEIAMLRLWSNGTEEKEPVRDQLGCTAGEHQELKSGIFNMLNVTTTAAAVAKAAVLGVYDTRQYLGDIPVLSSPREKQVAVGLALGMDRSQIATALGIGAATVSNSYYTRLSLRIGSKTRAETVYRLHERRYVVPVVVSSEAAPPTTDLTNLGH